MIARFFGYLVGGVFVLLLLAPIGAAVWFVYDGAEVLLNTRSEPAVIEECYYRRVRKGSGYSGSWGPLARTPSGLEVKGGFTWKWKSWCESDIGDEVTVFISPGDPELNRINTFFQFWFLPVLFALVCSVFYPGSYMVKKRRQRNAKS